MFVLNQFADLERVMLRRGNTRNTNYRRRTLKEKLIKIGAKVVCRSNAVTFQMAEVAVSRALFAAILVRICQLRASPQDV